MKDRQKTEVRAPCENADLAEKKRKKQKRELRRLFLRVIFWGIAGWVLFTQVFLFARVQGLDMFPALKDGDLVIAFRMEKTYSSEDVVVYEAEGTQHTGRIVACANDVVTMEESGTLMVNGTVQGTDILYPTYARQEDSEPVRVSEGCVYVLGDYRTQSRDSRDFGAIPLENVKGKVIAILRRRGI